MANPFCECLAAGFCERHQINKGQAKYDRCQGATGDVARDLKFWNGWERGELGATAPASPQINPEGFGFDEALDLMTVSTIGTKLHEIIRRETGVEIPCPDCLAAIMQLDSMTQDDVRAIRGAVVADIKSRAITQAPELWQRIAIFADGVLRTGVVDSRIESWVNEAIESGAEPKKKETPTIPQRTLQLRESLAALESRRRTRPVLIKSQQHPTSDQSRLYRAAKSKQPSPKPFERPPSFNLVWHFWPIPNAWEWHADRIRELLPTIDGQKIIGIATDTATVSAAEVIDRIGDLSVHYILSENTPGSGDMALKGKPYGELATAVPAFQMLAQTTDDSVTIYGHAKGMRSHTKDSEAVRLWTEMMYETVTFNWKETVKVMEAGYEIIGAFRTFGFRPLIPQHSWHYSGTFYNFRTRALFQKAAPIQQKYGGTEAWPGDHVPADRAWCSFQDNSPWLRQYDAGLMYPAVVNAQMQWEADRIGGPRCEQHLRELEWFVSHLRSHDKILVIGSKHGGLESAIKRRLPNVTTVSIDIAPQQNNTQEVIVGSSADPEIQRQAISRGLFDVVFIDGDHGYQGVKTDWEFAQTLHPRLIAFHDIASAIKHRNEGCQVDRLWKEIQQTHDTAEKIVGCGWGGIGVVKYH